MRDIRTLSLSFSRNPYSGERISQCTDVAVLAWKLEKKAVDPKRSDICKEAELIHIEDRLKEIGIQDNGRWVSKEVYDLRHNAKIFSKNPYRGEEIFKCEDAGVLTWKLNNEVVDDTRDREIINDELRAISNRLMQLGGGMKNGRWYTVEQLNSDWMKQDDEISGKIEMNEGFEYQFGNSGINLNGCKTIAGYTFYFNHKVYYGTYYCPVDYALPIQDNGKTCRVKNKKIRVNSYERSMMGDEPVLQITSWEII